jgi:hypothetical protein
LLKTVKSVYILPTSALFAGGSLEHQIALENIGQGLKTLKPYVNKTKRIFIA